MTFVHRSSKIRSNKVQIKYNLSTYNHNEGKIFLHKSRAVWVMETKQARRAGTRFHSWTRPWRFLFLISRRNKIENKPKATEICWMWCLLSQVFTFDSKHTRSRNKIRAQQQRQTFGVVSRRQFGANYIPMISCHSQAPHVQGHFEIWKQVFTLFLFWPPFWILKRVAAVH